MAQFLLLEKLYKEEDIRILVTRKTRPALKASCWLLFKDLLELYNVPYEESLSSLEIINKRNILTLRSLDDPEKIKSSDYNYIWAEEATELNKSDYKQLNLRLRRKNTNGINQIFFTFNPIDINNYIYQIINSSDVHGLCKTTYLDNTYLDKDYIKELIGLKDQDPTYYKIYTLGEWATPVNIIFSNYEIVDEMPSKVDETIYGLDFGYNNPTSLLRIDLSDTRPFISEPIYQRNLTNADLLTLLGEHIANKSDYIYADCAEPARIEEIKRAGYNIHPADKSVEDGIDYVKRNRLFINRSCVNLIKEIGSYKAKEDKNGNVLDEPVKFNDHAIDAVRYALYTHHLSRTNEPNIRVI